MVHSFLVFALIINIFYKFGISFTLNCSTLCTEGSMYICPRDIQVFLHIEQGSGMNLEKLQAS